MLRFLLAAVIALLAAPAAAHAHPLGNFSVNHLSEISVSSDRVDVRYILDAAEIPTLQGTADARAELPRLKLTVDGQPTPLTPGPATITQKPGQGGLKTSRTVIDLTAHIRAKTVVLQDRTFPGRVGWKAVVPKPGANTATRANVPAADPTRGLRVYPKDVLRSPADLRVATLHVAPGDGTLQAPGARKFEAANASDGFAGILDSDQLLIVLLVAAFGWGAIHALSPGHGKAMVAAYLVGTQGRPKDAVALGAIVTATHTAGVFALGFITLALSHYVLPEDLFPYLNLLSGLLVVGVGLSVLRKRRRHHHHHEFNRKSLLAMGTAAGLIPCPSALVVLLGAISQDQIALGMLLIVAFSLGLAATLTTLGLAVVHARKLPLPHRAVHALPALSAAAIVVVGCVLTAHAIPTLTA